MNPHTQNRMYSDLAHLWPLVSHHSDYADEARLWTRALREKLGPGRHEILELGVGGGNNLHHILYPECDASRSTLSTCDCSNRLRVEPEFDATAVDISEAMLEHSKSLNPRVKHHIGDMRTVRLYRKFDAVLIHDAVTYLTTLADVEYTISTAVAHLNPGGVLVMAPDWFADTFPGTHVSHEVRADVDPPFTYIEYTHDPDADNSTVESIILYIFTDERGRTRVEQDRHITGIFSIETWLAVMAAGGLTAVTAPYPVHEDGREGHLLVGTLR